MSAELTETDLTEIENRHRQTTPGPWKSYVEGRDHTAGDSFIKSGGNDIYLSGATFADQDFIAAAHQDIPALIETIRSLRARLGRPSSA